MFNKSVCFFSLKTVVYLTGFVLFLACHNQKELYQQTSFNEQYGTPIDSSKCYFDFDAVDYYTLKVNVDTLWNILWDIEETALTETQTETKELVKTILYSRLPESTDDTLLINKLEEMGFDKENIDSTKFAALREIFQLKTHSNPHMFKCLPAYRNILVFKKSQKVMGIVKLCFKCNKYQIIGTTLNTDDFVESGDRKQLIEILGVKY